MAQNCSGEDRNFPGANPLPPTFDYNVCGERKFTNNEMASCIDVMMK